MRVRHRAIKEAKRKAKAAAKVIELRPGFRSTQIKKIPPSDTKEPDYLRTLEKRERWSDH
jgi:hypothetical protein